jgi:hypothetical protein
VTDSKQTGRSFLEFDLIPGEDPVNKYGYGVKSYFDLILWLIGLFTLLSIVNSPLIYLYSTSGTSLTDNLLTQ